MKKLKNYKFHDYKPTKQQKKTMKFILSYSRAYILSDMGTGKTLALLWTFDYLLKAKKVDKILVLMPLSILKSAWQKDLEEQLPGTPYHPILGTREKKLAVLASGERGFYLAGHDLPRYMEQEIKAAGFDVIIADEVTAYKNYKSQRSKALQRIGKIVKSVYGMSGTPTAGGPEPAFGVAKVIRPDNMPSQYITNYRRMTMTQVDPHTWIPDDNWKTVVFNMLQPSIRFTLEECTEMPAITFTDRKVEMGKDQKRIYTELKNHMVAEYDQGLIVAKNAGVKFLRLLQVSAGIIKAEDKSIERISILPKLNELINILAESRTGKIVVITNFIDTGLVISDFLTGKKIKNGFIYGDIPLNARAEIIEDFQKNDLQVIIAQPKVASHGLTLTAADYLLFFGPITGSERFIQCIGRIRRLGQTNRQNIIRLYNSPIEKYLFDKLENEKKDSVDLLRFFEDQSEK